MRLVKRISIALAGGTLLLIGIAMIILPGPALLVIPAALGVLAVEFVWARRWLAWFKKQVKYMFGRVTNRS